MLKKLFKQVVFIGASSFMGFHSWGASLQAGKYDLSINAYMDFEVTWMSEMAMGMNGMVMPMDQSFRFDQNHLNLILGAKRDKTRVQINLESRHSFSTFDGNTGVLGRAGDGSDTNVGSFRIAEAYGEYEFNQFFKVRGGSFLAPFGIFNESRYATPLFATVVLPFIYEMPGNYSDTPLIPSNANLMVRGSMASNVFDFSYNVYAAATKRNNNDSGRSIDRGYGAENSKDKSLGGKVNMTFGDGRYTLGFSGHYSKLPDIYDNSANSNNHSTFLRGIELDFYLPWNLHFQAEHVTQSNPGGKPDSSVRNKRGYYARLMYEKGGITPFVMYDVFDDPNDTVYKFKNKRIGIGTGYKVSQNFYVKGEWHWHWFKDQPTGKMMSTAPEETNMLRTSMIFFF